MRTAFQIFADRAEAGRRLAERLNAYARKPGTLVLGLPRGGVVTAYEVAKALELPLDVFIVRKLGTPGQKELAMGAVASGGIRVLNREVTEALGLGQADIDAAAGEEQAEIHRRERLYRGGRPAPELEGKTVLLVDDGLATGSTMYAATLAIRRRHPAGVVVAVPVAPPEVCEEFRFTADEVVCLVTPDDFRAVGTWYRNFSQTTDEEVQRLLQQAEEGDRHGGA
jgi:predicted phosphoribosyltransferase